MTHDNKVAAYWSAGIVAVFAVLLVISYAAGWLTLA
jgi:hypothetical protein|tara:strand:+ start:385 stop:492 length:108 start_codon:yes stop_codon:yes gene_type:complete